jgi:hypothetical protein
VGDPGGEVSASGAKRIYGSMQYGVDEAICERAKVYRVETVSVVVRTSAFESERVLLLKAGWSIDQLYSTSLVLATGGWFLAKWLADCQCTMGVQLECTSGP